MRTQKVWRRRLQLSLQLLIFVAVITACWQFLFGTLPHPLANFLSEYSEKPSFSLKLSSILIDPWFYISGLLFYTAPAAVISYLVGAIPQRPIRRMVGSHWR